MDYQQKVEHNKKPIIDKNFTELSETELAQFISKAKAHYFYYEKDGVFVACGKELDNKNGKFDNEMLACRKLAEYGHEVYLLPENYAKDSEKNVKVHGDTITYGRVLELKQTPSNVQGNYRKAKHQATDVFIHIQDDMAKENALDQIKRAVRSMKQNNRGRINFAGKVYLYFKKTDLFLSFEFDDSGNYRPLPTKKLGFRIYESLRRSKSTEAEHRPMINIAHFPELSSDLIQDSTQPRNKSRGMWYTLPKGETHNDPPPSQNLPASAVRGLRQYAGFYSLSLVR